jgi:hypothetical protein
MNNFQTILEHYLITLPVLDKLDEKENSATECGKIVNRVLENVY